MGDTRAGDIVRVRSPEEILGTLDENGCLDGLPFMPEMLPLSGQTFRVFARADKSCDTISKTGARRMRAAVHLEGQRCDGARHGGCEAGCLVHWKEAWLERVPRNDAGPLVQIQPSSAALPPAVGEEELRIRTERFACPLDGEQPSYACQATEMFRATEPMRWWDPRQYIRDLLSGNVDSKRFVRVMAHAAYGIMQRRIFRRDYPYVSGQQTSTPEDRLNLRPGELVEVRSRAEIEKTLDANCRNRGLWFDVEMLQFCGRTFRVLRVVERLIDERTGRMLHPRGACIILEGVMCSGDLSTRRLFCPRGIYPYWHEVWLKRPQ